MHTRKTFHILLIALALAAASLAAVPAGAARAQAGSGMDLVNAVNAYRAANGLQPYSVDGGLMSQAQGQSAYQAQVGQCTHTRSDGTGPGDHGISAENVACGSNISVQYAINGQWTDPLHTATMLGPKTGLVGGGSVAANGTVYYTLDVVRLSGDFNYVPPNQPSASKSNASAPGQDIGPVVTTTPNGDGSIAHVIKYGETLVEIADAYGISLANLISMNKLDPVKPVYYAGQVLIIRLAFTQTPFMTATYTPRPPTRTPQPTRTPRPTRTPTPLSSPAPTDTATREPLVKLPTFDELGPMRPLMAFVFIGISAIGLLVLVFSSFLPGKKG